ncbi:MAG: RNA polymerase-binding transcription factor DksA [Myxococcales bacterium]
MARSEESEARLTPEELAEFRLILEDKKAKILDQAKSALNSTEEELLRMSDEVDLASAEYEAAFEYRLRDREKYLLKKIDRALVRITEGEYDECENCGNGISKKRLLARPETTMCIDCKEEQEKVEKMYEKKRPYRFDFEI